MYVTQVGNIADLEVLMRSISFFLWWKHRKVARGKVNFPPFPSVPHTRQLPEWDKEMTSLPEELQSHAFLPDSEPDSEIYEAAQ